MLTQIPDHIKRYIKKAAAEALGEKKRKEQKLYRKTKRAKSTKILERRNGPGNEKEGAQRRNQEQCRYMEEPADGGETEFV